MIAPKRPLYAAGDGKARLMRWVLGAVVVLALTPSAFAQDLGALRGAQSVGPATFTRWSGFYFGGQVGYSGGNADFGGATQGPLSNALIDTVVETNFQPSSWPILGSTSATAASYGGFAGYNTQWQDLVIGGELTYSRVNMSFDAPSTPIYRQISTENSTTQAETLYGLTGSGSGTLTLIDYASLRARAGWIVGTNFLPYAFGGFTVGRANFTETASITGPSATTVPTLVPTSTGLLTVQPAPVLPCTGSPIELGVGETCGFYGAGTKNSALGTLIYGYSLGGGVDIALMSNVFLRGELEYVHFFPYNGIVVSLATARIGAGLKF
jgi:outer membrane immunogenic protein